MPTRASGAKSALSMKSRYVLHCIRHMHDIVKYGYWYYDSDLQDVGCRSGMHIQGRVSTITDTSSAQVWLIGPLLGADFRMTWKSISRQNLLILVIDVSNLIFLECKYADEGSVMVWMWILTVCNDSCRHGYKCRFLKAHMDEDGNLIKNEEVNWARHDDYKAINWFHLPS